LFFAKTNDGLPEMKYRNRIPEPTISGFANNKKKNNNNNPDQPTLDFFDM
jgi:hypothetical protein